MSSALAIAVQRKSAMQKAVTLFSRLMPLWVVIVAVIGFYYPPVLVVFEPYLDWMFFFTMLGIGIVLNFADFKPLVQKPQLVILGLLAQFSIMPALGFIIGNLLDLTVPLKLGLILVGSVPGAMASNVIAYLAKTDVAYSIALTSTATLLSPLLTPALTFIYAHTIIAIPFWQMFMSIIKMVILPLVIGFILKHFLQKHLEKWSYLFPAFSTVFIALICGMVVALNRDYIIALTTILFLAVFLHNFFGLVCGYAISVFYGFDQRRRRTLSIEVGMQNAGLGAVLALKHFSYQSALMPAVFATWCVITASILAEIWAKQGVAGEENGHQ
jgi:BASS family bile acid:Na+ symporter